MQNDIAISVEHLSKRYMIGGKQHQWSIRDSVEEFLRHPFGIGAEKHDKEEFWALNDISFEIKKGDVVGIIGRNGSGKSTLLKILARIVEPTKGKITMRGRVASLLEVGTGFNPELTGRENIYLNGAILGMSQKEIAGKFDEIVAFSGVEQFIDTPVKRYSSGMYVRLAFAVAAHLDSDILLVDEVLAVGDAEFQKKCLGKMDSLAKSGKTVLFVSHDISAVKNICSKTIILDNGKSSDIINTNTAISIYLSNHTSTSCRELEFNLAENLGEVRFCVKNYDGQLSLTFSSIEQIKIEYKLFLQYHVPKLWCGVIVSGQMGEKLFSTGSYINHSKELMLSATIPSNIFNEGSYFISLIVQVPGDKYYLNVEDVYTFNITLDTKDLPGKSPGSFLFKDISWNQEVLT